MPMHRYSIPALAAAPALALFGAAHAAEHAAKAEKPKTLVEVVRQAIAPYKDVEAAKAAGYGVFHGCVSGPQGGSMGVHLVNGDLVGDGKLDASKPEALIYEWKAGKLHLAGVEYIVIAQDWDAASEAPPMLLGQMFHYNGAPNRYRIPAFYQLHVWALTKNPSGTFADWNPAVSCDEYAGEPAGHGGGH